MDNHVERPRRLVIPLRLPERGHESTVRRNDWPTVAGAVLRGNRAALPGAHINSLQRPLVLPVPQCDLPVGNDRAAIRGQVVAGIQQARAGVRRDIPQLGTNENAWESGAELMIPVSDRKALV